MFWLRNNFFFFFLGGGGGGVMHWPGDTLLHVYEGLDGGGGLVFNFH